MSTDRTRRSWATTARWPTTCGSACRGPRGPPGPLRRRRSRGCRAIDHVFLFYFENQDVRAIVGDRRRGALLQQPAGPGQPARAAVCRGASQRRQLPGVGRWQHVRDPADRPAGDQLPVHDPRRQPRRPRRRRRRDVEGLRGERRRSVRRHRARLLLERRSPDDVFRRRAQSAGVLLGSCRASGGDGHRSVADLDDTELHLGGDQRLRRHGGLRHPRRRPIPGRPARADHAVAGVAHPALAGDHHLRRGRL